MAGKERGKKVHKWMRISKGREFSSPRFQPIIKRTRVYSQDNDKIDPSFGKQVAGMPIDDAATVFDLLL